MANVTANMTMMVFQELQKLANSAKNDLDELKLNIDQFFLITMGMICYLMQGGFAFLEAGAVRSKNSTNILIKNLMDSFVAGVAYWTIGFPLAYGAGNSFIGYDYWVSVNLESGRFAYFFFQYVFAATAATIVSGAMAERCEFIAYFIYSFFITAFVYPVVTHWTWTEEGWLYQGMEYGEGNNTFTVGFQDFAGSCALHTLSGVAAFVGALILGPRIGRFHPDQKTALDIRGHSVPFAALGGFILLFGFLAFNGGSNVTVVADGAGAVVSKSVVNTIIAGSTSAFCTLGMVKTGYFGTGRWSLLSTLNGALTGMVSVCSGVNVYQPWGSCLMGAIASVAYKVTSHAMVSLRVDDPLDAVAVHFGGGVLGTIAVAFLDQDDGILFFWDKKSALSLAWQLAGLVTITVWTAGWSMLMFGGMRLAGILRVSEELERKGLDIPKHGEPAYPTEAYGHGWVESLMKALEHDKGTNIAKGLQKGGFLPQVPRNTKTTAFNPDAVNSTKLTVKNEGHTNPVMNTQL